MDDVCYGYDAEFPDDPDSPCACGCSVDDHDDKTLECHWCEKG